MSIFKGNSIYNFGSNGSEIEEGGELVYSDFIKIENNKEYTLENSSNTINFYYDNNDNFDNIIDVTTNSNATINVYYVNENGVLLPIGYENSNSILAGNSYRIYITGDSFRIENYIAPNVNPNEFDQVLYGSICHFKKIGDYFWQTNDFTGEIDGVRTISANGTIYYNMKEMFLKNNTFDHGFKLPRPAEVGNLINALGKNSSNAGKVLKDSIGWNNSVPSAVGDNSSGLNIKGNGFYFDGSLQSYLQEGYLCYSSGLGDVDAFGLYDSSIFVNTGANMASGNDEYKVYLNVRFIKDA